jgi:hypothetical protein
MTSPIIRIFHPDGTETPVTVVRRDDRGSGVFCESDRYTGTLSYTRITVSWQGRTGYVIERCLTRPSGTTERTWQPCEADGIHTYGETCWHFDDAVAVVMNHVTPV